jgi:FkbM family methyltransferase
VGVARLWNRARLVQRFFASGGRLRYDREVASLVARAPAGARHPLEICVRSYRELRRLHEFGRSERVDSVWKWLNWIADCRMLYDIGASNGLEGLFALAKHGCAVAFVEPYTPSIESILKSVYVAARSGEARVEIVHAGCGDSDGYARLLMHGAPIAGENLNTFADPSVYVQTDGIDRRAKTAISQWVKGVSIDSLSAVHGLPPPSHVKIDVDGFEAKVIAGAAATLRAGLVESWAIETNGEANAAAVDAALRNAGYVEAERFVHYPGVLPATMDAIYIKPARLDAWRNFACAPRGQV